MKKRTLANLSQLPAVVIDGLRGLLKGGIVIGMGDGEDGLRIERSLPHGHVGGGSENGEQDRARPVAAEHGEGRRVRCAGAT